MIVRVLLVLTAALLGGAAGGATIHRDDGVHTEPWFVNQSFMFLKEEAETARAAGKGFAVIWEQPGCGSCLRLHEVNFQDKALADYIDANFAVMVMNLFGEIEVTDFDGQAMPEKDLAYKQRVNFTPTTIFFDADGTELFRMPGYLQPYWYLGGFAFVREKGYADAETRGMLPRWMQAKGALVRQIYGRDPKP